jgi:hypothetical protein
MPLQSLKISGNSLIPSTAQLELKRLREIEVCAETLYNETILGYSPDTENLKKLEELFTPPTDPDQLAFSKD